jgi:ATP-dependent protease ClpP protease subunit
MVSPDMAIECGFVDENCGKKRLTGMVSPNMAIECGFVDEVWQEEANRHGFPRHG